MTEPQEVEIQAIDQDFNHSQTRLAGIQNHIPISCKALNTLLLSDFDQTDPQRITWSRMIEALARVQRVQMAWNWDLLNQLYEPFDPDDTYQADFLANASGQDQKAQMDIFIRQFEESIALANFQAIQYDVVQHAVKSSNDLRLKYEPNFQVFEELRVYGRGRCIVERPVRSWKKGWRIKIQQHHAWHRLLVMVKFREGMMLGPEIKTDRVYLRLFKDVPFRELEMHLPVEGTIIRMPATDRFSIASPLLIGIPTVAYKMLSTSTAIFLNPIALTTLLAAPVASGWRSFTGFRNAKLKHTHQIISNLFYLTLGNNKQCITRVSEMAWEQETMETALAYRFIHESMEKGETITARQLDERVEHFMTQRKSIYMDYQHHDAIDKLNRLGLLRKNGEFLSVAPIQEALQILRNIWNRMGP